MRRPRIAERRRLASAPAQIRLAYPLEATRAKVQTKSTKEEGRGETERGKAKARASRRKELEARARPRTGGSSKAKEPETSRGGFGGIVPAARTIVRPRAQRRARRPSLTATRNSRSGTLPQRAPWTGAKRFRQHLQDYLSISWFDRRAPAGAAGSTSRCRPGTSTHRLLADPGARPCAEAQGGLSCCRAARRPAPEVVPVRREKPLAVLDAPRLRATAEPATEIPAGISERRARPPVLPQLRAGRSESGGAGPVAQTGLVGKSAADWPGGSARGERHRRRSTPSACRAGASAVSTAHRRRDASPRSHPSWDHRCRSAA